MIFPGNETQTSEAQNILDHYKQNNERGESLSIDENELENKMACSETLVIDKKTIQNFDETSFQYKSDKRTGG